MPSELYITLSWALTCSEDGESGGACGGGGTGAVWVSVSEGLGSDRSAQAQAARPLSRLFSRLARVSETFCLPPPPQNSTPTSSHHPRPPRRRPAPAPALDPVLSGGRHGPISSGALCKAGIQAISGLAYKAGIPRVVHCVPSGPRTKGQREGCRQWLHPVHQKPEAEVFRFSRRRVEPRAAASPPHPTTVREVRAFHHPSTP